jgi:hypothetical protein
MAISAPPPSRARPTVRSWCTSALLVFAVGSLAAPARADLVVPGPVLPAAKTESLGRNGRALAKKANKPRQDPSGEGDSAGKGKTGDDSAAKGEKSGKDSKSAAKSGDSLDSLMNDVVSDPKAGKTGKKDSKEMDALLKDVQKSDPSAAAPKKEQPTSAPPLSPADISTAMAQVKVKGNACAQRFGRSGTAELKITVARDGRVTEVQLGGKLAATPVAGCIEQAVKTASFRPNAGLKFDYRMDVR